MRFFENFGAVIMYAVVGPVIAALIMGVILLGLGQLMPDLPFTFIDYLICGAVLSATDPVATLAIVCSLKTFKEFIIVLILLSIPITF